MYFIKKLKIKNKLLLLLLILSVPLLFFLVSYLSKEFHQKSELDRVLSKLKESEILSNLLHEIQNERTLSLAFVASKRSNYQSKLDIQRQNTDVLTGKLQQLNPELATDFTKVEELQNFRQQIDQLNLDSTAFELFNLSVREKVLGRLHANAGEISDENTRHQLTAYAHLVEARSYLARLRTIVSQILITKEFSIQGYATFKASKSFFEQHIKQFGRNAPLSIVSEYQKQLDTEDYQDVIAMLADIDRNPSVNLSQQNPEHWVTKFNRAINGLKIVEQASMSQSVEVVSGIINKKYGLLFFYIAFALFVLILAVYTCYYIVTSIAGSLHALKLASDRVSRGNTDVEINIQSEDEIGDLANSFRKLITKNIQLSKVAEAIGEGRYDVDVEVLNEKDVLASTLLQMKDKLKAFSIQQETRQWHLNGLSELNTLMSSAKDVKQACRKVTQFIAEYIRADIGVLYLLENSGQLCYQAGYSINEMVGNMPSYSLGEGVIGQAALSNQLVRLKNVPSNHLVIRTAITQSAPIEVIIVPLHFKKEIIGILELAHKDELPARNIELLKAATERISTFIYSLKVHIQTEELLYETQNQAEELQTQQEELRQINAELKEQKEQLQASEEEVRVGQEELEEKNTELEEQYEAIRLKNRDIEEARQAIELKIAQVETVSRYKSEFLANMSHELRTPLNSILILSRLMADNTDKNLTPKQKEHAEIIHNSGSDLLKLINDILDLSKIESRQVNLEIKEFDPRQLSLEGQFSQIAKQKRIEFESRFADTLPAHISSDQFRLEQVLKNLISNAFKFTPTEGKVTLHVYPLLQKLFFTNPALLAAKQIISFAVQDTGIGIPKDKQQIIFEAFQQADTSTTRKYGGTGLGLAISRELVNLLGGEIKVESEENVGSTFTIYLPVQYQESDKVTVIAPPETLNTLPLPPNTNGRTPVVADISPANTVSLQEIIGHKQNGKSDKSLIIIEDDKGFSQIVADFAVHKHFKVWQAFTGKEGIDLINRQRPDAVLLDINLPDISGWDVLKYINETPALRHIKVHIMSAYDKELLGHQMDGEEYMPKPITLEMLDKAFEKIRQDGKPLQRVLIVEDHGAENLAITELLQANGISSFAAFSGVEAQEVLKKEKIDCIILDLKLPDISGYQLMETIRATNKTIPIVIYSGKELSEEEETQLKRYANTIIVKNQFSYIRLLDEVQLFLHRVDEKLPSVEEFKMKPHIPEEVLKNKKVLVADDDVRNIYSLCNVLEQQQMKIVVAYDGREAVDKISADKDIDIVLMDVMMPEMDGIEATKRIRQNPALTKLPVIALTAKAMKGDKEKCIQAGASDYISKPIDIDKLLALMRVWLYKD